VKLTLPLKTQSTSNLREHWAAKAKRMKPQRDGACLMVKSKIRELGSTRLVVLLTRIAPLELDDDNLRGALKAVRDGVASALRVDDRSPLVRWDYGQRKGEPHQQEVEVLISWEVPS